MYQVERLKNFRNENKGKPLFESMMAVLSVRPCYYNANFTVTWLDYEDVVAFAREKLSAMGCVHTHDSYYFLIQAVINYQMIISGEYRFISMLLEAGADPNVAGGVIMKTAIQDGYVDVVRLLLKHGATKSEMLLEYAKACQSGVNIVVRTHVEGAVYCHGECERQFVIGLPAARANIVELLSWE